VEWAYLQAWNAFSTDGNVLSFMEGMKNSFGIVSNTGSKLDKYLRS
jgi:hypothetical protein